MTASPPVRCSLSPPRTDRHRPWLSTPSSHAFRGARGGKIKVDYPVYGPNWTLSSLTTGFECLPMPP